MYFVSIKEKVLTEKIKGKVCFPSHALYAGWLSQRAQFIYIAPVNVKRVYFVWYLQNLNIYTIEQ